MRERRTLALRIRMRAAYKRSLFFRSGIAVNKFHLRRRARRMYKSTDTYGIIVIRASCRWPIDGGLASLVNTRKGERGEVISRKKPRRDSGGGGDGRQGGGEAEGNSCMGNNGIASSIQCKAKQGNGFRARMWHSLHTFDMK